MRGTSIQIVLLGLALLFVGCSVGTYSRCFGTGPDAGACVAAERNAPRLNQVRIGMTYEQVRTVMRKGPERREADASSEIWYYISDYSARAMTAITFVDGRVSAIRIVRWNVE